MGDAGAFEYAGSELELFSRAQRWKAYLRAQIEPYLGRNVLEVGAGLGATTAALCRGNFDSWTCLEPDASLAATLERAVAERQLPKCCRVTRGTIEQLDPTDRYDTILYIDVLEHIEDDAEELARAARILAEGGHVIVLAPAHAWLFTPFDKAIGHFRRYNKRMLAELTPRGTCSIKLVYLDAVGLLASASNRLVMRQAMPTRRQIMVWDRLMVPLSRVLDPLLRRRIGKSVLAIWRKML